MDPLDLDEYISQKGFVALGQVLGGQPEATIAAITASGLRGRGGAGFPTGVKWSRMRAAAGGGRHQVCDRQRRRGRSRRVHGSDADGIVSLPRASRGC